MWSSSKLIASALQSDACAAAILSDEDYAGAFEGLLHLPHVLCDSSDQPVTAFHPLNGRERHTGDLSQLALVPAQQAPCCPNLRYTDHLCSIKVDKQDKKCHKRGYTVEAADGTQEGTTMSHQLLHQLSIHQLLRERLASEFPDVDEETLSDTVEGMTDLAEMLAAVVRSHLDDVSMANALKERISTMQTRLSRLEERSRRKRELVASTMQRANVKKICEPDFTASLRNTPPAVILTEEDKIPSEYWKPQSPKLDRQSLLATLREGQPVPGAILGNGGSTVSVRVK